MSTLPYIVVKIGGRAAADDESRRIFAADLARVADAGRIVFVHGGGADVTEASRRFGIESVFRDGVRLTSEAEMPIVDMVLAGRANKEWVRVLRGAGLAACGISGADGGLVTGRCEENSRTAHVAATDPTIIHTLCGAGYVPVVAPVASDEKSAAVNINADEVALALAESLQARALIFVSDIPGVLRDGAAIPELDAAQAEREIRTGTIHGGMIPKVRSSVAAVAKGVEAICIGRYDRPGDLAKLLEGSIGTRIVAGKN